MKILWIKFDGSQQTNRNQKLNINPISRKHHISEFDSPPIPKPLIKHHQIQRNTNKQKIKNKNKQTINQSIDHQQKPRRNQVITLLWKSHDISKENRKESKDRRTCLRVDGGRRNCVFENFFFLGEEWNGGEREVGVYMFSHKGGGVASRNKRRLAERVGPSKLPFLCSLLLFSTFALLF